VDERKSIGDLGKCRFAGCDLQDVDFWNQDLRGSDFRKANLRGAVLGLADCREVDFRAANLSAAWMIGGKFLQADFSNAQFYEAVIRGADCRGAIFLGTDLTGVDFSFADIRNVDLSNAILERANLFRVQYDEKTVFPASFVIAPELRMEWKGAVKRESKYKSRCSLEDLTTLIPPPSTPRCAEGDWNEVEGQMGIHFPSDFKRLISAYGSGRILGGLQIFNPLTEDGRKSIAENLETLEVIREASQNLWPIHPEESGMLPWGHDWDGNIFCWLARGKPDAWPTGQLPRSADEPVSDDVNMTTFLFNYARNQYTGMLGCSEFKKSSYKFSPA
jgi:hypothetical protein